MNTKLILIILTNLSNANHIKEASNKLNNMDHLIELKKGEFESNSSLMNMETSSTPPKNEGIFTLIKHKLTNFLSLNNQGNSTKVDFSFNLDRFIRFY